MPKLWESDKIKETHIKSSPNPIINNQSVRDYGGLQMITNPVSTIYFAPADAFLCINYTN